MNKVSIIIPIYNAENTIERCLESVVNQEYKNIEIILVNDGSTDNTENVIKNNFQDKRIKYYKQKNSGVSVARNYGISKATGEYIFFIDADDTIDKNVIKELVDNLDDSKLVGTMYLFNKKDKCKNKKRYTKIELINDILTGDILGVIWGYLFKTSIVKKIKFDKNTGFLEDTIFLINYLNNSDIDEIKFVDNESYYNYMENPYSITANEKKTLKKCIDFNYSLNKINILTDNKFKELIENKKNILLEKELRFIRKKSDLERIYDKISIQKYKGKNIRLRFFSFLFRNKKSSLLILYYKIRTMIKKVIKR